MISYKAGRANIFEFVRVFDEPNPSTDAGVPAGRIEITFAIGVNAIQDYFLSTPE